MIAGVAALISLCLSMAILGWERSLPSPVRSGWEGPGLFSPYPDEDVYGCCEESGCDCGNIFFACPMCPGTVDLAHAWLIKKAFYRTAWAILGVKRGFDRFYMTTTAWVTMMIFTNGSLFVYGYYWNWGKQTRTVGCQKDCDVEEKLEQWQNKHRKELEQMAKTIEFMQRKYRRQTNILERKELTVDLLETGVRHLYRSQTDTRNRREIKRCGFQLAEEFQWD